MCRFVGLSFVVCRLLCVVCRLWFVVVVVVAAVVVVVIVIVIVVVVVVVIVVVVVVGVVVVVILLVTAIVYFCDSNCHIICSGLYLSYRISIHAHYTLSLPSILVLSPYPTLPSYVPPITGWGPQSCPGCARLFGCACCRWTVRTILKTWKVRMACHKGGCHVF